HLVICSEYRSASAMMLASTPTTFAASRKSRAAPLPRPPTPMTAAMIFTLGCACRMLGKLATAAAEAASRLEFRMNCRRVTGALSSGSLFMVIWLEQGGFAPEPRLPVLFLVLLDAANPILGHFFGRRNRQRPHHAKTDERRVGQIPFAFRQLRVGHLPLTIGAAPRRAAQRHWIIVIMPTAH